MSEKACLHCGGLIKIRIPVPKSGCDHLYYPDNCEVCKKDHFSVPESSEISSLRATLEAERALNKRYKRGLSKLHQWETYNIHGQTRHKENCIACKILHPTESSPGEKGKD